MCALKLKYFKELLSKKYEFFTEEHSGSFTQKLNRDVSEVANTVTLEFAIMLKGVFLFIGGFVMMISNSPLTLFSIIPITILIFIGRTFSRKLRARRVELSLLNRKLNSYTQDIFRQIRTVKLFLAETLELDNFLLLHKEIQDITISTASFAANFFSILEFTAEILIIVICASCIYLTKVYPELTLDKLISIATYGLYCAVGFRQLLAGYAEISKASGLYESIQEAFNDYRVENIREDEGCEELERKPVSLMLENVYFKYPNRDNWAIEDISLSLKPGEILALVGPSGHGKSTIFNLITKLYEPTSGKVFLGDIDISNKPSYWVRDQISIVSQEPLLFSGTLHSNLTYSRPKASETEILSCCKRAGLLSFIQSLPDAFNTKVGESGGSLSGGQRQRVCIARALLKQPRLLLLDEATAGLDPRSEQEVQSVLEEEVQQHKYTVIIITHRVSSLSSLADNFALMHLGKLVNYGHYSSFHSDKSFNSLCRV